MAEVLDKDEPAVTERALTLLTAVERREADIDMKLLSHDGVGRLAGRGFEAFLARRGRQLAKADPDFRKVAEAFWVRESGAAGIVEIAGCWVRVSPLDRPGVIDAVRRDLRAAQMLTRVRNAILLLGGKDWLAR